MSFLNDKMRALMGANWKTTLSGWASALLGFATVLSLSFDSPRSAVVCGVLTAFARILAGLVAADAIVDPSPAPNPATLATSITARAAEDSPAQDGVGEIDLSKRETKRIETEEEAFAQWKAAEDAKTAKYMAENPTPPTGDAKC